MAGGGITIEVVNYVAKRTGNPTPDPTGASGTVAVGKRVCTDDARAGDVDFLVFNAQATADDCRGAEADEASFTLTASDGDPTFDPVATNQFGNALFRPVPAGV